VRLTKDKLSFANIFLCLGFGLTVSVLLFIPVLLFNMFTTFPVFLIDKIDKLDLSCQRIID